ncbi:hypothetical protein HPB48_027049 [Haemaphysalis longicornis]|uniref:5'-nucleotidase n=1 Tax=Haemaphysalis longicornis TaxID=44386 RepID=A0A9J6H2U6_HAELO|nr:hypothetical protein HPB48_027049 [Haemaphysalis longicornis]
MPFKRAVDDALKKVVGSTKVLLEASHKVCRVRECNLGNLITDSFFDYYANKKSKVSHAWSEVNAAVINGGTVRESIGQNCKEVFVCTWFTHLNYRALSCIHYCFKEHIQVVAYVTRRHKAHPSKYSHTFYQPEKTLCRININISKYAPFLLKGYSFTWHLFTSIVF